MQGTTIVEISTDLRRTSSSIIFSFQKNLPIGLFRNIDQKEQLIVYFAVKRNITIKHLLIEQFKNKMTVYTILTTAVDVLRM